MGSNPRKWGYVYAAWSSRLLCHYLRENHGMHVSRRMVRRALHQMGYRYKRPRYVLARRSPTWQQAKGAAARLRNRKQTVFLLIPLAAIVYLMVLLALKTFTDEDWDIVKKMLGRL